MVAPQHSPRGRLLFDVMLAVVLFVGESVLWVLQPPAYQPSTWLWPLVWLGLAYGAVALRRTAVHWAVAILLVNLSVAALIKDWDSSGASLIVLTYTIAATCSLRYTIGASVLLWLGPLALALTPLGRSNSDPIPVDLPIAYFVAYNVLLFLLIFFIGRTVHNRRAYVSALEDRARAAERGQLVIAEQAVADERRRIARELHDVVAHHVSVMSVLATGTRRALSRDPVAADEALATIEETGRVALREMRRLLVVLRTDAEPAGELEPQPGLPGLEGLIEQVREAGLPVQLTTFGEPGHLDPGVALAVYRITQEALTNALKHAGPASAEVRLSFAARELAIEISDTGRGPRPGPRTIGHGLLGMRERISLYGGSLRAGPRPGGGFRVFARIPLEGEQGNRPAAEEKVVEEKGVGEKGVGEKVVEGAPAAGKEAAAMEHTAAEKAGMEHAAVERGTVGHAAAENGAAHDAAGAEPSSYQGTTGHGVGAVRVTSNNGKDPV